MEVYEESRGFFCGKVYDLPTSESRAPETIMFTSTIRDSKVEVGQDHHGFCDRVTDDIS